MMVSETVDHSMAHVKVNHHKAEESPHCNVETFPLRSNMERTTFSKVGSSFLLLGVVCTLLFASVALPCTHHQKWKLWINSPISPETVLLELWEPSKSDLTSESAKRESSIAYIGSKPAQNAGLLPDEDYANGEMKKTEVPADIIRFVLQKGERAATMQNELESEDEDMMPRTTSSFLVAEVEENRESIDMLEPKKVENAFMEVQDTKEEEAQNGFATSLPSGEVSEDFINRLMREDEKDMETSVTKSAHRRIIYIREANSKLIPSPLKLIRGQGKRAVVGNEEHVDSLLQQEPLTIPTVRPGVEELEHLIALKNSGDSLKKGEESQNDDDDDEDEDVAGEVGDEEEEEEVSFNVGRMRGWNNRFPKSVAEDDGRPAVRTMFRVRKIGPA